MTSERESQERRDAAPFPADAPGCAASCPLARIPESAWRHWLHVPFSRRHPWLVRLAILAVVVALAAGAAAFGRDDDADGHGERLALVSVSGVILDTESDLNWIRRLRRSPGVKGVLLRVNSPGGGAAASQELHGELKALAAKKPLFVSMGGMAASGGVMIAMAGTRVYANASTVTGSIGVRMDIPQLGALMEKIGVGQETLTTAPYKDAGSPMRPLTPEQRACFASVLSDMHEQFVDIVAEGRRMPRERAAALADGRIFTGREAVRLGLADEIGGMGDALQALAAAAGVPPSRPLLRKPPEGTWLERLIRSAVNPALFEDAARRVATPVFLFHM